MKTYFKLCLLSPVWLPALMTCVCLIFEYIGFGGLKVFPDWLAGLGIMLFVSMCVGGIQYLIALAVVWRRIDFDSIRSITGWCVLLPLIFAPIQLLGMLLFLWSSVGGVDGSGDVMSWFAFAGVDLLFGYAYVLLWFVGYGAYVLFRKWKGEEVVYGNA